MSLLIFKSEKFWKRREIFSALLFYLRALFHTLYQVIKMTSIQFKSAISFLPERIKNTLNKVPENLKSRIQEIRVREGLPVCLTIGGKALFLRGNGQICEELFSDVLKADKNELDSIFLCLCNRSVYAHEGEIREGFIPMPYGNRAGICGTFTDNGNFKDISSVNIRIAGQIMGCAEGIFKEFDGGMLIAGPPGSGKTTMLRDLTRLLARKNRVAVVDSRGELSGSSMGRSFNDLGENTDILMIKNKAMGIEMAVRTLFPDIVVFDEIGTDSELLGVKSSLNSGVKVITTAHIGEKSDLMRRSVTRELLISGAISKVVILSPYELGKTEILRVRDIKNEAIA